jgi:hypothetical protein
MRHYKPVKLNSNTIGYELSQLCSHGDIDALKMQADLAIAKTKTNGKDV